MMKLESIKDDPPDLTKVHPDSGMDSSVEEDSIGRVNADKSASFSVLGLYTKYYPTKEELDTWEPQFVLCRRRMHTRPLENASSKKEYETALFVPEVGLAGPKFWNVYDTEAKVVREDRAILFQSKENYEELASLECFEYCFENIDYMEYPTFGEQVIVNGIDTSELAIGDVFEIEGGHSPLVIEITAPRKPCSYINYKHDTACGIEGMQHYTHLNNMAGWFARVLVAGELTEEMKFVRTEHPNPKWTLDYTHKALYGEGNLRESMMRVPSWNRDRKELEELIALPQLGEYEWKAEGRRLSLKLDGIDWKKAPKHHMDPQVYVSNYFMELFGINLFLEILSTVLKYFGIL
mmetsp:Transcript_22613/g.56017  ORF Transcript_22613/g.56017 Transcript_22613/m.56017 type:complete len:350 (+) Transcript_22613:160-1209(+)